MLCLLKFLLQVGYFALESLILEVILGIFLGGFRNGGLCVLNVVIRGGSVGVPFWYTVWEGAGEVFQVVW